MGHGEKMVLRRRLSPVGVAAHKALAPSRCFRALPVRVATRTKGTAGRREVRGEPKSAYCIRLLERPKTSRCALAIFWAAKNQRSAWRYMSRAPPRGFFPAVTRNCGSMLCANGSENVCRAPVRLKGGFLTSAARTSPRIRRVARAGRLACEQIQLVSIGFFRFVKRREHVDAGTSETWP